MTPAKQKAKAHLQALIKRPGEKPFTADVIGYAWDFERQCFTESIRIAEGIGGNARSVAVPVGQFEIIEKER
jgi:hypothetical protein